jgi:hypothetical protein
VKVVFTEHLAYIANTCDIHRDTYHDYIKVDIIGATVKAIPVTGSASL